MDDTRPLPGFVAREVRILRSATSAFIEVLKDFDAWAEQAADVNRLIRPDYAAKLAELRQQVRDAQLTGCIGSPAAIGLALAALLGEVQP